MSVTLKTQCCIAFDKFTFSDPDGPIIFVLNVFCPAEERKDWNSPKMHLEPMLLELTAHHVCAYLGSVRLLECDHTKSWCLFEWLKLNHFFYLRGELKVSILLNTHISKTSPNNLNLTTIQIKTNEVRCNFSMICVEN